MLVLEELAPEFGVDDALVAGVGADDVVAAVVVAASTFAGERRSITEELSGCGAHTKLTKASTQWSVGFVFVFR